MSTQSLLFLKTHLLEIVGRRKEFSFIDCSRKNLLLFDIVFLASMNYLLFLK